jgi:signal transduction histidine kinase
MAFLNIVKNAVEAMPEGGALEISSRRGSVAEAQLLSGAPSSEGASGFVEIAFKDTGCGIPDAVIGKVMTPHFTTKKGGTGLGLAVVSKIVSQHGGRVFIQSPEAKGTLVRIVLPTQRKDSFVE